MGKLSGAQQYIIRQMQSGKRLSCFYATHKRHGPVHKEFGANLEGRTVSILAVKVLLNQGLLVEKHRHPVSDDLERIEYELSQEECDSMRREK